MTRAIPNEPVRLDLLEIGEAHVVAGVVCPAHAPDWSRWLDEIGFVEGEPVTLLRRGMPAGDPLVYRVGQSTFALRQAEAACVLVRPLR